MYYLFLFGEFLASIFPRRICYFIARQLSLIKFYLSKKDREALYYNFSAIIPDKKKIKKVAKESFINFGYYLVDFFRYSKLNLDFIKKYVKIENIFYLDNYAKEKKGLIILTAHIGNYELGGVIASILGYKFNAVALSHKDKRLDRFFNKKREMFGMGVIPIKGSAKKCLSVLDKKQFLCLLGDRDFTDSAIETNFFNRKALIPRGFAFLATRKKVDVLAGFFIRENTFYYRLIFEEPIKYSEDKKEEDIIREYVSILEKYIKKYPEQWYIFEKYWL